MNTFNRMAAWGMVSVLLGLSGCVIAPDHEHYRDHEAYRDHDAYQDREQYRYQNGDRIDRAGHRDVRWCDRHHDDDEHCR
jgi:hypothetical protein